MRVPEFVGASRTTMSLVKPIQRLRWLASIRPADLSEATIVQPISWAVSLLYGQFALERNDAVDRRVKAAACDLRSSSRYGRSDFGVNAERIRDYLTALRAAGTSHG